MIPPAGIALLVLVTVALLAWVGLSRVLGPASQVDRALEPYHVEGPEAGARRGEPGTGGSGSPLFRRAVAVTERVAGGSRLLGRVEQLLARADVAFPPAEALLLGVGGAVGGGLLLLALTRSLAVGLAGAVVAALVPLAVLRRLASRRKKAFANQLPDTLAVLASSLKSGYSLLQGVQLAAEESADPMGAELRRVLGRGRLGMATEDALDEMASRLENKDWTYAMTAVRIQQELGGNLAELLTKVAETIRIRDRLRREVDALTAEGRLSAIVIGLLPAGLGLIMFALNPDYMRPLFTMTAGKVVLGVSSVLAILGYLWTRTIVRIDI